MKRYALAAPLLLALPLLACQSKAAPPAPEEAAPAAEPAPAPSAFDDPPGVPAPYTAELKNELAAALAKKGPKYEPRTHHFKGGGHDGPPRFVNRLILQTSPYLLQHAHNPVNWRPWGDEAFAEARRRDVPVILSVGYSTCHWCHVMEKESFEDLEIAAFMNGHFVAIKVDREERPDVDSVYMSAVNMLTGRGGWPMTVVMTPDREPFFAGTYFPARTGDRGSRKGFLTILQELSQQYGSDRKSLLSKASEVSRSLSRLSRPSRPGDLPGAMMLGTFAENHARRFDTNWGGWGRAPKFPRSATIRALLRYHRRTGDALALKMATLTLDKMAEGGMYDHVGGGFHRYSVDGRWLVPHFEKMLYDNAQLAVAYVEAWQHTHNPDYARVARETLDYVQREMTGPQGAFYSATDADSEGHEGTFFLWQPAEIESLLGPERAKRFMAYYGVSKRGNFEGKNILNTERRIEKVAAQFGASPADFRAEMDEARKLLYAVRKKRIPPLRDDKHLAAWNGLMISAFVAGARAFGRADYEKTGLGAARFVLEKMRPGGRKKNTRLYRAYLGTHSAHEGFLDDYALMTEACLDLFELTADPQWLDEAIWLQSQLDARFADPAGGYFFIGQDHEKLLAREKPAHDGAVPSGNSVAALNLLRLFELTGEHKWLNTARSLFRAFSSRLRRSPGSMARLLLAVDMDLDRVREVAVVARNAEAARPLLEVLHHSFVPNRVLALGTSGKRSKALAARVPWAEGKVVRSGDVTAYVCEKGVCELPTSKPEVFRKQLAKIEPYEQFTAPKLELAKPIAPWHYNPQTNKHWHPGHGHWHDGKPPPPGQRK